jgi:hypothetical protein
LIALRELLVRRPFRIVHLEFSQTLGYELPVAYRSKMLNFLMWHRVSYRRPKGLPLERRELLQAQLAGALIWSGLALATADDDADSKAISVEQFSDRLHYIFNVMHLSFNHFLGDCLRGERIHGTVSCEDHGVGMCTHDMADFRQFVSLHGPKPHTVELDVNVFGAQLFGRSLAAFVKLLLAGGTSRRRIQHLVGSIERELRTGIEGQVGSILLVGDQHLHFKEFLKVSHLLSTPIARVLTFLRSPDGFERVRKHYDRFDPTVFQFVLDDLPDFFEDSAVGKIGIIHALIFAQANLGETAIGALKNDQNSVELPDLAAMNFLRHGDWSSASNYAAVKSEQVSVDMEDLRCALENRARDSHLSLANLAEARIAFGRRLSSAMRHGDRAECARVLLQSGILQKIVTCLGEDQRQVHRIAGLTSRFVALLPLVAWLFATRCTVVAWCYRLGWRVRWKN